MCEVEHVFLAQDDTGSGMRYESNFCILNYKNVSTSGKQCKPQIETPAGVIYTALTGSYSKRCPRLPEEDVRQAALCLFYYPFVEDESMWTEIIQVWRTPAVDICFTPISKHRRRPDRHAHVCATAPIRTTGTSNATVDATGRRHANSTRLSLMICFMFAITTSV